MIDKVIKLPLSIQTLSSIIMAKKALIPWNTLVNDLTANFINYHHLFYANIGFTGPTIHFHHKALQAKNPEKIDFVYAVLTAWGMHRMGARLNSFEVFEKSINDCAYLFVKLAKTKLEESGEYEFNDIIKHLFLDLDPMASEAKIVGVSKLLAHYIPDIIAPIDRRYTFQFLNQKKDINLPRNWDEFELFREIHLKLFKPVALNDQFREQALIWLDQRSEYPWDTSIPKIIDNLIIGKLRGIGWIENPAEV